MTELRHTLRTLGKAPGFAAVAIVTVALGIASATAIYSVANGVVFRPLPFRDEERLAWIWSTRPDRDRAFFSIPDFLDLERANTTTVDLAASTPVGYDRTGSGEPERQAIDRSMGSMDSAAYALVSFALLGVLLAAVGIHGVIAHSVVQRTNEIGIRMALGAQVRDVLGLILGGGLRLTAIGMALGLAGTLGMARLPRGLSPEFAAADPALTVAATAFLVLVATFACWLPARRATKVDPMIALRAE